MKLFNYLLLLSISVCSSAFAFGFDATSNNTLTCPESFPILTSPSPIYKAPGFYGIYGTFHRNKNVYSLPVVLVNAQNQSDAETTAVTISKSGLIPYSRTPIPDPDLGTYFCAYYGSAYSLQNESPGQAEASKTQAAVVILYPVNKH